MSSTVSVSNYTGAINTGYINNGLGSYYVQAVEPATYVTGSSIVTGSISAERIQGGEIKMVRLYKVYVVDNSDGEILVDEAVVATTEEDAKFKVGVYSLLDSLGLSLGDITVLIQNLGSVKLTEKK